MEHDSIRLTALEQVNNSLHHHTKLLVKKKEQLASGLKISSERDDASSNEKDGSSHERSRRIAIEDTIISKGHISFADVAGLEQAKNTLREAIVLPLQYPHFFTGGRKPWKRILLYGPPGTGKTRLAQAVASEIDSTFYCVSSADLVSSWVGESERLIKELFNHARKRDGKSLIFIDEIDSICRKRNLREEEHTRRIKTELLKQMEGVDSSFSKDERIFFLCATNCPWELDTAFLRRFQKRVYIPLPDREARRALIKLHVKETVTSLSESDWEKLAGETEGFSGSDLASCVSDAMFEPLRELRDAHFWEMTTDGHYIPSPKKTKGSVELDIGKMSPAMVQPRAICLKDFLKVISNNHRTVTQKDLEKFEEFTAHMGQTG
ncbi:protein SUPPRESSOR OF K(+) TRANSPORT GROWTH DEFECT 1-like [Dendronephthya gigantea]|uniref:protein SUPPRESSOR OF K(+) TRANSPORT GROWTH DEFECT 1-like n=1 Tax=Dendronephthya gigantea TaxID=151771 RepID=UPI0010692FCC|nr:protein SUPPRESSOR OF K(+) TRANSPORT GROWTH DEFECT 1-like [Dendronephthya gigantea]